MFENADISENNRHGKKILDLHNCEGVIPTVFEKQTFIP